jgi:anaerobic magnesium-protoporphyrin IX monomethyl ester cyclase
LEEETDRNYWHSLRQLLACDPDRIDSLYVTPHRRTPCFHMAADRRLFQPDLVKWDYKHQVIGGTGPTQGLSAEGG